LLLWWRVVWAAKRKSLFITIITAPPPTPSPEELHFVHFIDTSHLLPWILKHRLGSMMTAYCLDWESHRLRRDAWSVFNKA
jgi:hypothetical protein